MKCSKTAKTSTSGQYACEVPLPGEVSSVPGGTKASAKLQKPPVAVFGMPVKLAACLSLSLFSSHEGGSRVL